VAGVAGVIFEKLSTTSIQQQYSQRRGSADFGNEISSLGRYRGRKLEVYPSDSPVKRGRVRKRVNHVDRHLSVFDCFAEVVPVNLVVVCDTRIATTKESRCPKRSTRVVSANGVRAGGERASKEI
jgi:hypothetical protein